jgi:hypothetical protein
MKTTTTKTKSGVELKNNKLYTPKEIVDLPVVKQSKLIPSVFTLYRLMKNSKIAITADKSTGDLPRYLISGKAISTFLKSRYQVK